MSTDLFDRHRQRLDDAVSACASRGWYSAFDESPSPRVYGEHAAAEGRAAFDAWLGGTFPLTTPGADETVSTERSPYGFDLDIAYPRVRDVRALVTAAEAGMRAWREAGPDGRTGVCLEILDRLHQRIFELANAVQHTSGQAFVMAFQAGGANALDRALEAIAYAWTEMHRTPTTAVWEKPARGEPLRMEKTFTIMPRGVALVIGCNTFPTWNSWPGLFASLVTGNPVVVKPHPAAVLPLAITVQVCQEVLAEQGFDPDLVTLAAEEPGDKLAAVLAVRPEVRIIDFTGGTAFGEWLEQRAHQAVVFTEKAGVNCVVIDSTSDFAGMCQNLAFSLALYTGQMCTAPQDIFIPAAGIETDEGHKSPADVGAGIGAALDRLLGDDARAVEILGAVVSPDVLTRVGHAATVGEELIASREVSAPGLPRCHGPHPAPGRTHRRRRRRLRLRVLRPGVLPDPDRRHGGVDRALRDHGRAPRCDDRVGLLDLRRCGRRDARGRARGRRRAVGEPPRRRLRQPVGGVLGLPRHRRQPCCQRDLHRQRLRRLPLPGDPVPPSGHFWRASKPR